MGVLSCMTGLSFRMWLCSGLGTTHDHCAIGLAGPSILPNPLQCPHCGSWVFPAVSALVVARVLGRPNPRAHLQANDRQGHQARRRLDRARRAALGHGCPRLRGAAARRRGRRVRSQVPSRRGRRGRQRWYRIGPHGSPWTPETARAEARQILAAVARGEDPAGTRQRTRVAMTMSALLDRFLADHVEDKLRATTRREYRRLVSAILKPALGAVAIAAVTPDDVAALH